MNDVHRRSFGFSNKYPDNSSIFVHYSERLVEALDVSRNI